MEDKEDLVLKGIGVHREPYKKGRTQKGVYKGLGAVENLGGL